MSDPRITPATRRQLLAAVGGGSLALALATSPSGARAQAAPDYSSHLLTGMWLAKANPALPEYPLFPAPSLFAADGSVIGSVTIDGYPSVDEGDMSFTDRNDLTHVTIRDVSKAILQNAPLDPNVRKTTAIRMAVEAPGFPEATPAVTPVS